MWEAKMCIAYNSFINLFFSGVADKPRKKRQYIFWSPIVRVHAGLILSYTGLFQKWPCIFMEICSYSDKVNSVFCSFDFLGFSLLPLRTDLFTWLLLLKCSVCSQHYIQLPVKHWPLVYIVLSVLIVCTWRVERKC